MKHYNLRSDIGIFALMLILSLSAGCKSDSPTEPTERNISGTYNQRSIDGNSLPWTLLDTGSQKFVILSGVLKLNSNKAFEKLITIEETNRIFIPTTVETTTETLSGVYSLEDSQITFTEDSDGSISTGNITGNTITWGTGVYVK